MRRQFALITASLLLVCGAMAAAAGRAQTPEPQQPVMAAFDGQDQFSMYCASCHGPRAKGDGPVAASLRRRPPDLTAIALRNGGTFDADVVFQIIDGRKPIKGHRDGDMPQWGDAFSRSREGSTPDQVKERIDAIVRWLGRIQQQTAQ